MSDKRPLVSSVEVKTGLGFVLFIIAVFLYFILVQVETTNALLTAILTEMDPEMMADVRERIDE